MHIQLTSAIQQLETYLKKYNYTSCLVFSDHHVFSLYGNAITDCLKNAKLSTHSYCLTSGEQAKTLSNAEACWQKMHHLKMDRHSLMVSLGGGVVTDMAGFIASCYMRGIDLVHIPTTLLAMVDASIGGKTGVNLPSGKNLIGSFYDPKCIFIDPLYLQSLPQREFCSGLAEVIKCGVIKDPELFMFLEKNHQQILQRESNALIPIINKACSIKMQVVDQDPQESGLRAILNYGHTFAHAIETATHYNVYSHGEAVSIGMCCAARTSLLLGLIDNALMDRQKILCQQLGLPTSLPKHIDSEMLIQHMLGDKKTVSGKIRLVLPHALGKVSIENEVPIPLIHDALRNQRTDD